MDPAALARTVTFQLGTIGSVITERFATAIAEYDLKPKHAGVLQGLLLYPGISQQELSQAMHVAPSLMVGLLDHLEGLDAVTRERDANDRRRQIIVPTATGTKLYAKCVGAAKRIQDELMSGIDDRDGRFAEALRTVAANLGLPAPDGT